MKFIIGVIFSLLFTVLCHAKHLHVGGSGAIVIDYSTDDILFEYDAHKKTVPSSMTKMMTLYIIFDYLARGIVSEDHTCFVNDDAYRHGSATSGGATMFLKRGERAKLSNLIKGIAVVSGNDASIAAAECVSGSMKDFVSDMNMMAKELGMENTNFLNASGWPEDGHYSTVYDLTVLAMRLYKDFPQYYDIFKIPSFEYNGIKQKNINNLIQDKSLNIDGVKTGNTTGGGYGIVASSLCDGRRIFVGINGLSSVVQRSSDVVRLFNLGFNDFKSKKLFEKGEKVADLKVFGGVPDQVGVTVAEDINIVYPVHEVQNIKIMIKYDSPLNAPLQKGDRVGNLYITVPEIGESVFDIFLLQDIKSVSILGETILSIQRFFGF